MIQLRTAKVLAAVLMGCLLGTYIYHDEVRWIERGRDAFLAYQDHRFDRLIHHPHFAGLLIAGILATMAFIGFYELLSAGIGRVFPGPKVAEDRES